MHILMSYLLQMVFWLAMTLPVFLLIGAGLLFSVWFQWTMSLLLNSGHELHQTQVNLLVFSTFCACVGSLRWCLKMVLFITVDIPSWYWTSGLHDLHHDIMELMSR